MRIPVYPRVTTMESASSFVKITCDEMLLYTIFIMFIQFYGASLSPDNYDRCCRMPSPCLQSWHTMVHYTLCFRPGSQCENVTGTRRSCPKASLFLPDMLAMIYAENQTFVENLIGSRVTPLQLRFPSKITYM